MDTPERPAGQETAAAPDLDDLNFDQPVAVIPIVGFDQPLPGFEPVPGQPSYGGGPPKPLGPPKSVAGAALLNLTGLGLGYGYLRNRWLLMFALVGTTAVVTTAFLTDAAAEPWLWRGITLGWLVGLGAHAAYLASRRAPGAAQRTPVLAGVAAVALVVAGYVGYGLAGASAYDRGVAAQTAGDCATATDEFASVTGPYELTLSTDVLDAGRRTTECATFQKAVTAQRHGDFTTAIALYEQLGKGVLAPYAHTNLADTHFAKATSWHSPVTEVDVEVSVDTLLRLGREFADTDAAKKASQAIADLFAEATKPYGAGKFCESLEVLGLFAALDPSSVGAKVSADANAFRARSLYECGLSQARANQYEPAITTLETFVGAYPNDGGVPQARSALITAKVAVAAKVRLPVPGPLGGNDPGPVKMTFYNDSATPVTVYVAGPTAHEISIPGCPGCREMYPKDDPAACHDTAGRPSVTLHLLRNPYYFTTTSPDTIREATGSINPAAGYEYWQCLFKETL